MTSQTPNIPRHVAIIMDGNGRWAKNEGEERLYGHKHGVDSVRSVVRRATDIGVEYLTIYAFSTENWGRPTDEVDGLMQLLSYTIMQEIEPLRQNGVKLHFIGDTDAMPSALVESIRQARNTVVEHVKLNLVIALNYSSRWEITQAVKTIASKVEQGAISATDIDETTISSHLATANIPDPELLIRTSGEQRLSNFLLWQLSYTELYFTDTLWPDFSAEKFQHAITAYQNRERRFGLVK